MSISNILINESTYTDLKVQSVSCDEIVCNSHSSDSELIIPILASPEPFPAPVNGGLISYNAGAGYEFYYSDGVGWYDVGGANDGDVQGPLVSTDSHLSLFDGVSGKLIKNSNIKLTGTRFQGFDNGGSPIPIEFNGDTDHLGFDITNVGTIAPDSVNTDLIASKTGSTVVFNNKPQSSTAPTVDDDLTNKLYVDQEVSNKVAGPILSTDNAIPRYDGITGKLIQDSTVLIDDSNNLIIPPSSDLIAADINRNGGAFITIEGVRIANGVISQGSISAGFGDIDIGSNDVDCGDVNCSRVDIDNGKLILDTAGATASADATQDFDINVGNAAKKLCLQNAGNDKLCVGSSENTSMSPLNCTDTTNAISSTTGSIKTAGGVGILQDLVVGGNAAFIGRAATAFVPTAGSDLTNKTYVDGLISPPVPAAFTVTPIGLVSNLTGTPSATEVRFVQTGNVVHYSLKITGISITAGNLETQINFTLPIPTITAQQMNVGTALIEKGANPPITASILSEEFGGPLYQGKIFWTSVTGAYPAPVIIHISGTYFGVL